MSASEERIIKKLIDAVKITSDEKTTPYDTPATVTRIDGDTVWVHMSGGVDETPVKKTISCKVGDVVQVRSGGGNAWVTGNASAPPTDDTKANIAQRTAIDADQTATEAKSAAESALNYAQQAETSAQEAKTSAQEAYDAAEDAQSAADDALLSATTANAAANGALDSLATVQDVIGVLNWASQNAEYERTSDTEIVAGKTYWTRSGTGTEADPYVYTPVANPIVADLATYYEISSVDEAMADYINSHLALTDEGLYVLSDNSEWKVLIASDGVYIKDRTNQTVGAFSASGVSLGDLNGANYVQITPEGFRFTMDGGTSDTIAAKLNTGSATTESVSVNNIQLQNNWFNVISLPTFDANIAMGRAITMNVRFQSPEGTGDTYQESFTFTAGTQAEHDAFEYYDEDNYHSFVRFGYDGMRKVTVRSAYKWSTLLVNVAITYYVQNDRSAYFTFGERIGNAGKYSGIIGRGLRAQYDDQVAVGRYNDNQSGNLFEVGKGTSNSARSNAFEVDDSGNATAAGDIEDGNGNVLSDKQDTLVSGTNIKTVNSQSLLGSGDISISGGGSQNTWYGTSDTSASTQTKVVTTTSGDFELQTGNIIVVKFAHAQTYNGGYILNVDGTGAVAVKRNASNDPMQYSYLGGEVVTHVYDGTNFLIVDGGVASTTYYGVTKLSSSVSSNSTALAATASAVKAAYDQADNAYGLALDAYNTANAALPAASVEDYVTEQGTSGSWRYRKWNSGKIEAWFEGTFSCAASTTARGALYYSNWSLTIPSAIGFTSAPNTLIGNTGDSTTVIAVNGAASSATAMSGKVWRYASSSSALTISARIYAWQD